MKIKVAIVDDHEIVLQGLRLVLGGEPEAELVGEASNAVAALECIAQTRPDIVLLDFELPDSNGVLLSRQILARYPKTRIIIFSAHMSPQYIQEAVQAGVSGYLGKIHKTGEIGIALRAVQNGQLYFCPEAATVLAKDYLKKADALKNQLSDREQQVLKRIAEGQSTKEMAAAMHVSVKTVETHRQKIMGKLDLHSVAELTKYAIRQGLTRV